MKRYLVAGTVFAIMMSSPAMADWNFSGPPNANAFIQTGNMTLELSGRHRSIKY